MAFRAENPDCPYIIPSGRQDYRTFNTIRFPQPDQTEVDELTWYNVDEMWEDDRYTYSDYLGALNKAKLKIPREPFGPDAVLPQDILASPCKSGGHVGVGRVDGGGGGFPERSSAESMETIPPGRADDGGRAELSAGGQYTEQESAAAKGHDGHEDGEASDSSDSGDWAFYQAGGREHRVVKGSKVEDIDDGSDGDDEYRDDKTPEDNRSDDDDSDDGASGDDRVPRDCNVSQVGDGSQDGGDVQCRSGAYEGDMEAEQESVVPQEESRSAVPSPGGGAGSLPAACSPEPEANSPGPHAASPAPTLEASAGYCTPERRASTPLGAQRASTSRGNVAAPSTEESLRSMMGTS